MKIKEESAAEKPSVIPQRKRLLDIFEVKLKSFIRIKWRK